MRSQVVRRVGDECDRPQRGAFLRAAAVVSRIDVAAPRLKQSHPRRGCFDGPPAAPPLAVAPMPLGESRRPGRHDGSDRRVGEQREFGRARRSGRNCGRHLQSCFGRDRIAADR
jgi:hypothetical protein